MIGEIGGDAEERAADFIKANVTKPVVGYVAGFTAPEGKTMGHAGAIVSGSAGTAQAKQEALEAAGVRVGKTPSETARLMREIVSAADRAASPPLPGDLLEVTGQRLSAAGRDDGGHRTGDGARGAGCARIGGCDHHAPRTPSLRREPAMTSASLRSRRRSAAGARAAAPAPAARSRRHGRAAAWHGQQPLPVRAAAARLRPAAASAGTASSPGPAYGPPPGYGQQRRRGTASTAHDPYGQPGGHRRGALLRPEAAEDGGLRHRRRHPAVPRPGLLPLVQLRRRALRLLNSAASTSSNCRHGLPAVPAGHRVGAAARRSST